MYGAYGIYWRMDPESVTQSTIRAGGCMETEAGSPLCVWQQHPGFLALNEVIVKERTVGQSQRQLTYISILMSLFSTILNCCSTLFK